MSGLFATPTETVLGRLREVKRTGFKSWVALCPSHDDARPSLSIRENGDGKLLLHCFAGCDVQSIVRSLGVEMSDLFPSGPRRTGSSRPADTFSSCEEAIRAASRKFKRLPDCRWDYRDARGEHVGVVLRWNLPDGKTIRPIRRNPDGTWSIGSMPEPRPLYRLRDLLDAGTQTEVVVVEGERCCDVLARLGMIAVTSSGGAKAASKSDWRPLAGRRVILCPDADSAGRRYVRDVARILAGLDPRPEVRLLDLSRRVDDLPEGGDIADVVEDPEIFSRVWGDTAEPADVKATIRQWLDQAEPLDQAESRAVEVPLDLESLERAARGEFQADDSDVGRRDENGRIIINIRKPFITAQLFLDDLHIDNQNRRTLVRWNDEFYLWSSGLWKRVGDDAIESSLWHWLAGTVRVVSDGLGGKKTISTDPKTSLVKEISNAIRAITRISDDLQPPCWLDGRPAANLVPVANGLLDLESERLQPHDPTFFNLSKIPHSFVSQAPEPRRWVRFLQEVFEHDPLAIDVLKEFFGYTLLGDTRFQKMLLLVGPPASGKSTIVNVLEHILGDDNVCCPQLSSLGGNFALQSLIGKLLIAIPDARLAGDKAVPVLERILSIAAGDRLQIDRKFLEPVSIRLNGKILIATNELPRFSDDSGALLRRLCVVRTVKGFVGSENFRLLDELLADGGPALLAWALAGLRRLQQQGRFTVADSGRTVIDEMKALHSTVSDFIAECCVVDRGATVSAGSLYKKYLAWAEAGGGFHVLTKQRLGAALRAALPWLESTRSTNGIRFYKGLGLR